MRGSFLPAAAAVVLLLLAVPCLLLQMLLCSRALWHAALLHLLPFLSCGFHFLHGCACAFATSWLQCFVCLPLR